MSKWVTNKVTDEYREVVDIDTGAIRKIKFASDKQMWLLEKLRKETSKNYTPLKNKPSAFAAAKQIDKLMLKTQQSKLV